MSQMSDQTIDRRETIPHSQDMSPTTRQRHNRSNSISQDSSEEPSFRPTSNASQSAHKSDTENWETDLQDGRDSCQLNNKAQNGKWPKLANQCQLLRKQSATTKQLPAKNGLELTPTVHGPGDEILSEDEIVKELGQWIAQKVIGEDGRRLSVCFVSASLLPPVTKKSLSELDIGAIITNAKLRHDVNFDSDLHFRPNFDGEKGKEKIRITDDYWAALQAELEIYNLIFYHGEVPDRCRGESLARIHRASERRMPLMFGTIQEILKNLVPDRDQGRVDDQLDVSMLMQQIKRGIFDLVNLARWLAELLKAHCAPMRDDWVDKMVKKTEIAVETSRSDYMVEALRELLGILEAMKLDVANHQIRHLRVLLIEDTVNFEQKYHLSRIARDRINVDASQQWFAREQHKARQMEVSSQLKEPPQFQFETFLSTLLRLMLSNNPRDSLPETFYLDSDRLRTLRAELGDLVYFDISCQVFNDIVRRLGHVKSIPDSTYQMLRHALHTVVRQVGHGSNQRWVTSLENVAVELVRHALHECRLSHSYDPTLVHMADESLRRVFQSAYPDLFAIHAERVHRRIFPQLLDMAQRHISLSPIDLFNSLVIHAGPLPPLPPSSKHPPAILSTCSLLMEDAPQYAASHRDYFTHIARRITHIAVLHWHIWSPIVYTRIDGNSYYIQPYIVPVSDPHLSLSHPTAVASLTRQRSSTTSTALPIRQPTKISPQPVPLEPQLSIASTEDDKQADSNALRNADPEAETHPLGR